MRFWSVAPLLALSLACSRGDRSSLNHTGLQVTRDTIGDTVVVRTVSGSAWGSPGRLEEKFSIGVVDGDENLMLGTLAALAVASDGSIYLSERTPALKKFGPDGSYLKTFGRLGSGPGEYRRPDGGLAILPDGRVVLRDPGNARLQVYSADGVPLATWRISGGFNTGRKLYSDTAGNVFTLILYDAASDPTDWTLGLLRFGPDGLAKDSIKVPKWSYDRAFIKGEGKGSTSVNDVPFSAAAHWTLSPLGYLIGGVSNRYRIDLFRPGKLLRIEREMKAVPVQSEEAADRKRVETENMERNFPGWVWNGPDIPGTKPWFRDIFAGQDGRIWVLLSRPGRKDPSVEPASGNSSRGFSVSAWTEPVAFDVFEPDGRYLGEVSAPEGFLTFPEPIFRGDTVWAGVENVDGVRFVGRFEIARDSTPGT